MKKSRYDDLSIIIPVRIDSIDRLENLVITTRYINKYFIVNIYIFESDCRNKHLLRKVLPRNIKLFFLEDYDTIFHRTKFINMVVVNLMSKYVAVWDADIIISKEQFHDSVKILRDDQADFVYPYNRRMYEVPNIFKKQIFANLNISFLDKFAASFNEMYGTNPVGGCFFANRLQYINSGLENENYYGWGIEDGERFERWSRLNYRIKRVNGNIYHFFHERKENSVILYDNQNSFKFKELNRIKYLPIDILQQEICSWISKYYDEYYERYIF